MKDGIQVIRFSPPYRRSTREVRRINERAEVRLPLGFGVGFGLSKNNRPFFSRIRQEYTVIEEISLRKKSAVKARLSDSRYGGAFSERLGAYEDAGSRPRRLRGSKGVWGAWSPPGFSVPFQHEKEQCLHKSTERWDTGNECGRAQIAPMAKTE